MNPRRFINSLASRLLGDMSLKELAGLAGVFVGVLAVLFPVAIKLLPQPIVLHKTPAVKNEEQRILQAEEDLGLFSRLTSGSPLYRRLQSAMVALATNGPHAKEVLKHIAVVRDEHPAYTNEFLAGRREVMAPTTRLLAALSQATANPQNAKFVESLGFTIKEFPSPTEGNLRIVYDEREDEATVAQK